MIDNKVCVIFPNLYAADGHRAGSFPIAATALAAEGRWLVAYVPDLKAIARFRVETARRK